MADRRVGITGLGVVAPTALGAEDYWRSLLDGARAVKTVDLFDASGFDCTIGGQLDDFSARKFVPKHYRKAVKVMARDIEIAVAAAELAFRDAGIRTRASEDGEVDVDPKRLGCNIGAGLICTDLEELGQAVTTALVDGRLDLKAWGRGGMDNLTPLWLLKYLPNMLSCHVTIIHGAEGPSNCITCGDPSGILAVGESTRLIAHGRADVVVAGGAESKLNPMGLLRQGLLRRLCVSRNDHPAEACRPFDAAHDGTVIGEGGGVLILEEIERARQRGARIHAEIVGFGAAADPTALDVLKPAAGGLSIAAGKALADAGITAEQVDLLVAHGTGVPAEDRAEADAWAAALGSAVDKPAAVALAGGLGSTFAGSGGIALATAAMALNQGVVPGTVNFEKPADGVPLNLATEARQREMTYALVGSFTVGGQAGACVLKKCEA